MFATCFAVCRGQIGLFVSGDRCIVFLFVKKSVLVRAIRRAPQSRNPPPQKNGARLPTMACVFSSLFFYLRQMGKNKACYKLTAHSLNFRYMSRCVPIQLKNVFTIFRKSSSRWLACLFFSARVVATARAASLPTVSVTAPAAQDAAPLLSPASHPTDVDLPANT